MWFDVEKRYKTILTDEVRKKDKLWFDVEKRYKTIPHEEDIQRHQLWFDVEKRYKTIGIMTGLHLFGCGLM